jgi:deoxyribodipyrimidine photo-lyase
VTALVWLRRDLRVQDHPALRAALAQGGEVIPVFVLDARLLAGRQASGSRTQFMLECLHDLERSLRSRGSGLVIRRGTPERTLAAAGAAIAAGAPIGLAGGGGPRARRPRPEQ